MSFGEHIEELRVHLILALLILFVGVLTAFLMPMGYGRSPSFPPLNLGQRVIKKMEEPAHRRPSAKFYAERAVATAAEADARKGRTATTDPVEAFETRRRARLRAQKDLYARAPAAGAGRRSKGQTLKLPLRIRESGRRSRPADQLRARSSPRGP